MIMGKLKEGLIHIYTGNGKGKTTAAVGLGLRAAGAGLKICFMQFLKGYTVYNEAKMFKKLTKQCRVIRFKEVHPLFCSKKNGKSATAKLKKQAFEDFKVAKNIVLSKKYDLVIMDEVINIVCQNFVPENELIKIMDTKPKGTELVLTGRDASQRLIKKADYVTEMYLIKHPYYKGTKARIGIEV